jgi:hypothetical protein
MNIKYILIILGLFCLSTSFMIYTLLFENIETLIYNVKWFLRTTIPFLIVYLIYLGSKK